MVLLHKVEHPFWLGESLHASFCNCLHFFTSLSLEVFTVAMIRRWSDELFSSFLEDVLTSRVLLTYRWSRALLAIWPFFCTMSEVNIVPRRLNFSPLSSSCFFNIEATFLGTV